MSLVNISEKHRPKKLSEFVGNEEQVHEAFDLIKNNKSVILCGPPGVGKTTLAFVIANELGLVLRKTNASDERRKDELHRIECDLKMRSFVPMLYLFDEIDGIKDFSVLLRLLKKCKSPIILTANDKRRLPKDIFKFAKLIEFKSLKSQEIVKRIREIAQTEGVEVDYSKITNDLRESINRVFYNSDFYVKDKSDFDKVNDIFRHKAFYEVHPMWLIDNLNNYYNAAEMLDALETINAYEKTKNPEVLRALPVAKSGRPTYPNYFRQMVRNNG